MSKDFLYAISKTLILFLCLYQVWIFFKLSNPLGISVNAVALHLRPIRQPRRGLRRIWEPYICVDIRRYGSAYRKSCSRTSVGIKSGFEFCRIWIPYCFLQLCLKLRYQSIGRFIDSDIHPASLFHLSAILDFHQPIADASLDT